MSSLLEQAIVDAKALKEAALKNAEASIIEKYSAEVKSTLDELLEQDEEPPGMEGDFADLGGLGVPPEGGAEEPAMAEAAEEGESLFEDETEVTLSATDDLDESDVRLNKEDETVPVTVNLDALREAIEELESQLDEDEEIEKYQPLNLYGWSKQNFDLYAKKAGWLDSIVGLKYFNVYGPNEEHKGSMRSVVSKAYEQIQETGEMTLFKSHHPDYEDGKQMRDFLYVKDAVSMTLWLANNDKANGLFNLGNGNARSWLDLAHAIFSALKMEPNIRFVEMPEILREKYQYFTEAKVDKLGKNGFLTKFFDLEDAVKDYVTNYLVPDLRLGQIPS